MAKTVNRYERTGLDTGTGDRSAARMAGSGPSAGTVVKPVGGAQTIEQLFQGLIDKQTENERVATAAQKARNAYMSGEPVPLNSAGTQTIVDVNAQKTLTNTANTLKVSNQGYADKGQVDLENERAKKASGLGQYSGTQGGVVTDVTDKAAMWRKSLNEESDRSRAWEMKQAAANTDRLQVEGQNAAGQADAQAKRYAAAVAANAQRDAAAYSALGQIAGGAGGGFKYWGG